MSTLPAPFTVCVDEAPGLAEIAASLPLSLAATDVSPQIAAVDGAPGWARRAGEAIAAGARAVVVRSPATHDGAPHLPADAAARAVVAWEFAANPGVLAAAEAAAPLRERAVLAECRVTLPDEGQLDAALLDAVTACGRVFGTFGPVEALVAGPAGRHCAGRLANGAPLTLALVVSAAAPTAALSLRLLTDDGGITAHVPSAATAAPAEVRVIGPDGELLLPTLWETSRRATWRRAIAIAGGGPASEDVAEFHHTVSLALPSAGRGSPA